MELVVEKGLKAALLADTGVSTLVGTQIVNRFARVLTLPCVTFSLQTAEQIPRQARAQGDFRYLIEGLAEDNALLAAQIAAAIYAALHEKPFATDAPYSVYRVQRLAQVESVEQIERRQIYHHGGLYRIRVSGS